MQDVYFFERVGVNAEGKVQGRFRWSGEAPKILHRLKVSGIGLPDGIFDEVIASRGFQRLFPAERLKAFRASFHELKGNRETCASVVALPQTVLLADRPALDRVVEAFARLQARSADLVAEIGRAHV